MRMASTSSAFTGLTKERWGLSQLSTALKSTSDSSASEEMVSAARLRLAAVAAVALGGGLSPAVPVNRALQACSMELATKTNETTRDPFAQLARYAVHGLFHQETHAGPQLLADDAGSCYHPQQETDQAHG